MNTDDDWVEPLKNPVDILEIPVLEREIYQPFYNNNDNNNNNNNNDIRRLDPFFEKLFKPFDYMYSDSLILNDMNISQQVDFNEFCNKYSKNVASIGGKFNNLHQLLELVDKWFIQNPSNVYGFENYLLKEFKEKQIVVSSIKVKCIIGCLMRLHEKYKNL
jgi:hypothetical protein